MKQYLNEKQKKEVEQEIKKQIDNAIEPYEYELVKFSIKWSDEPESEESQED